MTAGAMNPAKRAPHCEMGTRFICGTLEAGLFFAFRFQESPDKDSYRLLMLLVQRQVIVEHVLILTVKSRRYQVARRSAERLDDGE